MSPHVAALGLLVAACDYSPKPGAIEDGPPGDGAADTEVTGDARTCDLWMPVPKHFAPCAIPLPGDALVLGTAGTWS